MRHAHLIRIAAAAIAATLALPAAAARHDQPEPENFTANAIVSNNLRSGAGVVQIQVTRWSTTGERERLVKTLLENGPDALLEALRDGPRVGNIRTPDSLGYPLHYAHERKGDDGLRHIVLATDRPISFWELRNQPRTIEYPFTVIQMQIGENNRGKGTLSYATKITVRGDVIELEDFATSPVMLNDIRSDKGRN